MPKRFVRPAGSWSAFLLAPVMALALALAAASARADRLVGLVERVTDGDSLWVRVLEPGSAIPADGRPLKVRMAGIDAPERCQSYGASAGQALRERVLGRQVHLDRSGLDGYERSVARVWLEGEDVGAWMVEEGHAWSYARRSTLDRPGGTYARQQRAATAAARGLFAQFHPVPPWVFRSEHGPCER